jgi:3-isopropylmalate/(R)-2-methylmalate dehydratase small subunit
MKMTVKAIVIKEDNVDTDVLYPGKFLNILDPKKASEHLFEGLDPKLRELLTTGPTALFVEENFGCGSSREQPASAMKASGVQCIFGKSFARIFGRNCVNSAMPAFINPNAVLAVKQGDDVQVDIETGVVTIGNVEYPSAPVATLPQEIVKAGGLVPWVKAQRITGSSGSGIVTS